MYNEYYNECRQLITSSPGYDEREELCQTYSRNSIVNL